MRGTYACVILCMRIYAYYLSLDDIIRLHIAVFHLTADSMWVTTKHNQVLA